MLDFHIKKDLKIFLLQILQVPKQKQNKIRSLLIPRKFIYYLELSNIDHAIFCKFLQCNLKFYCHQFFLTAIFYKLN